MKTLYLTLLMAAFAFAGTQTAAAQTGTFCFDDGFYDWTLVVNNNATDLIVGSVGGWTAGAIGTGGRGQTNATLRHHVLTAINPFLANDPGCTDGNFFTDWFTYNGNVTGNSFPYTYSGDWVNSCGSTGTFSGPITPGACPAPAPRPSEAVPGSPGSAVASEDVINASARAAEALGVAIHPNPAIDEARISYTLSEATDVRVVVYDMLGRQVATLVDDVQEAGAHEVVFDARGLASGTYVYQLVAGKELTSGQLTLTR